MTSSGIEDSGVNRVLLGQISADGQTVLSVTTVAHDHALFSAANAAIPMVAAAILTPDGAPIVIQAPVGPSSESCAKSLVAQLARMARRAANDKQ